jgi:hypothetical protein
MDTEDLGHDCEDLLENIEWEADEGTNETQSDDEQEGIKQEGNSETIEFEYDEGDSNVFASKRKPGEVDNRPSKKQRIVKILTTDDAYEIALHRCQDDLTLKVSWLKDLMSWSSNEVLASVVQSLLPLDLLNSVVSASPITRLEGFANWMRSSFKLIANSDMTFEEGRDGCCLEDLLEFVIPNRVGSLAQISQLCIALLTSFGYRCRLVACIDMVSLSPLDHPDLHIISVTNPATGSSTVANNDAITTRVHGGARKSRNKNMEGQNSDDRLLIWVEVWLKPEGCSSSSTSRWVPLHPMLNSIFNCPEKIESIVRKGKVIKCAISVEVLADQEELGFIFTDVTARYNFKHQPASKIICRMEGMLRNWLKMELEKISIATQDDNRTAAPPKVEKRTDGTLCIDLVDDSDDESNERRKQEKEDLVKSELENKKHNIPKTFAEFKDHPYYLLERHLLSDEVIHPDKKKNIVGLFKGEPIYLQSDREKLRTKIQWRKELRMVLAGAQPIKTTKRQVRKKSSSEENASLVSTDWKLFGIWQTQVYEVRYRGSLKSLFLTSVIL